MRGIVADTNIYISALVFRGLPDEVLTLARRKQVELFICEPILEEIQRVLVRKFDWSLMRTRDAILKIQEFATRVDIQERISAVQKDDADNRIIECALAARAEILITGDLHLLELGMFRDIRILTPRAFLDEAR